VAVKRNLSAHGMLPVHIAPCGMNCRLCVAYTREKNPCPGCRGLDRGKPKTRFLCRIRLCTERGEGKYCFRCGSFPCDWLDHLDRRYRRKYSMSMCDNLERIRASGVRKFLREEKVRWSCPGCGRILSVHRAKCLSCGRRWRSDAPHVLPESDAVRSRRRKVTLSRSAQAAKRKGRGSPFR